MTTTREQLLKEIDQAPDLLLAEVLDFLLLVKNRGDQSFDEPRIEELELDKPIWEYAQDLIKDIPSEELERLPRDGSVNHDYYLYGASKVEE